MRKAGKVLLSGLLGAVVCGALSAAAFSLVSILDGARAGEAVAYGVIVGLIAALAGAVIGLAVGIGNLGVLGGGIAGFLVTLGVVAIYVLSNGRPGRYVYFLRESGLIVLALALPTILAGVITALLRKALRRS
jgi:hypothetical protein